MIPFLVTVDAEADDLWTPRPDPAMENAAFLPRFQALCEEHGLTPTWLVDWRMSGSPVFLRFAGEVLRRGAAEIGMHLHAWDTPPATPLDRDAWRSQPYLIEYDDSAMRDKVGTMTRRLAEAFGAPPRSHRAGRWALDRRLAAALVEGGIEVDTSVTPHVSWRRYRGARSGGTDYRGFPERAYRMDPAEPSRAGAGRLKEVPVSIAPRGPAPLFCLWRAAHRFAPLRRLLSLCGVGVDWLRPDGRNRAGMLRVVERAVATGATHLNLALHSSELMPGGSPTFRTPEAIERLYADLEAVFAHPAVRGAGAGLAAFAARI